jgi:GntR family histidine utilization transcriptional repressor
LSVSDTASWRDIREEILRRIHERVWAPGDPIPNEADLAVEFDCARTTVSRALRDLAEKGLVVRKRRAGTRVAVNPPALAMLQIPVLREEIESRGFRYRHAILEREIRVPPSVIRHRLDLAADAPALKVVTLHLADARPYTHDDRWINIETVPEAATHDFADLSPNEWLVQNAPYTHGDIAIVAERASAPEAEHLGCRSDDAILVLERATWRDRASITTTRMAFAPGYRLITGL